MKILQTFSRYFIAAVFLFSGFVKGVDPLGTAYKIEDYFVAYSMDWALPLSLILAFALIGFELSLGIMLAFKILPRFTRVSMAVLMLFFSFVTLYDALYNPVPDCGCFGDALVITNWQTFYKNILIDILLIPLFFENYKAPSLKKHLSWGFGIYFIFIGFSYYNYRHLPLIDFRFWKIGAQVIDTNQKPIEIYLTYKNTKTSEEKEFLSSNFPYQDSLWLSQWKFVSSRQFDPNKNSQSVMIFDLEGNDVTAEVLAYPGKSLLLISNNLDKIQASKTKKLRKLIQLAEKSSIPISLITASLKKSIERFSSQSQIDIPFYLADDIDLKTMVRSNPGLILLENGKVLKKWAFADFPTQTEQIKAE
jgi:uncharacterized membrane protein YphA (DoxX/SURF4 family)